MLPGVEFWVVVWPFYVVFVFVLWWPGVFCDGVKFFFGGYGFPCDSGR